MIADSNETVNARRALEQARRQREQADRLAQVEQELAAARAELAAMIGDDVRPALDMMREDRDRLLAVMENISSVYFIRPDQTGNSGSDLETILGVTIDRCLQRKGGDLWAVRCGGNVLANDGTWELEPMPSNRDAEFMQRCRFPSFEAAFTAAGKAKAINDD